MSQPQTEYKVKQFLVRDLDIKSPMMSIGINHGKIVKLLIEQIKMPLWMVTTNAELCHIPLNTTQVHHDIGFIKKLCTMQKRLAELHSKTPSQVCFVLDTDVYLPRNAHPTSRQEALSIIEKELDKDIQLRELIIRGRHLGIFLVLLCQEGLKYSPEMRRNIGTVIIEPDSGPDVKNLIHNFALTMGLTKPQEQLLTTSWQCLQHQGIVLSVTKSQWFYLL